MVTQSAPLVESYPSQAGSEQQGPSSPSPLMDATARTPAPEQPPAPTPSATSNAPLLSLEAAHLVAEEHARQQVLLAAQQEDEDLAVILALIEGLS